MIWKKRMNMALNAILIKKQIRKKIIITRKKNQCVKIKYQNYCNFSSNDYLGLSQDSRVINAWKKGADIYGLGSGSSTYMTGYTDAHAKLEEELADWLGFSKAILFISGFTANETIIASLVKKKDCVFADRLTHTSLLYTAHISHANLYRFKHNQVDDLIKKYNNFYGNANIIITEGVFSMDGDNSPLLELQKFSKNNKSLLIVDDAHGIGTIGLNGRGSCWDQHVKPDILIITFGKAFGISGAAVLCNADIAKYLSQFSRHLIYSTSMPPAQAYAIRIALHCIQEGDQLRNKLNNNIKYFRNRVKKLPFLFKKSHTAIQPLIIGDNHQATKLSLQLKTKNILVTEIRPPTVPIGSARLRITLNATHSKKDINQLLDRLYEFSIK